MHTCALYMYMCIVHCNDLMLLGAAQCLVSTLTVPDWSHSFWGELGRRKPWHVL